MKAKFRSCRLPVACAIVTMSAGQLVHAQSIIEWSYTGSGTAWYTNTNWNPNTTSGAWLTTDIARF